MFRSGDYPSFLERKIFHEMCYTKVFSQIVIILKNALQLKNVDPQKMTIFQTSKFFNIKNLTSWKCYEASLFPLTSIIQWDISQTERMKKTIEI
jgi:hypothetical protein